MLIEIRFINENPDSVMYRTADVIWIWKTNKWSFRYEPKRIRGQYRLYIGLIAIWWGMLHEVKK